MLGIQEAQLIRNFVNNHIFQGKNVLSLENAANMYPIPGARRKNSYTVLGIQIGS